MTSLIRPPAALGALCGPLALIIVMIILGASGAKADQTFTTWGAENVSIGCFPTNCTVTGTVTTISPDPFSVSDPTALYSTNLSLNTPIGSFPLDFSGCDNPANANCGGSVLINLSSFNPSAPTCPCPAYPVVPQFTSIYQETYAQLAISPGYNVAWGTTPGTRAAPVQSGLGTAYVYAQLWPPQNNQSSISQVGGRKALPGGLFVAGGSTPSPTVGQLASMADFAWYNPVVGKSPGGAASKYTVLTSTMLMGVGNNPVNAVAYVRGDPDAGGQIVIAPYGGPGVQLEADPSFLTGTPTSAFTAGVNNVFQLVKTLAQDYPSASFSLTGVSLGGGVAQVLGSLTGLETVSFSAPGGGQLVSSFSGLQQTWNSTVGSASTPLDVSGQLGTNIVNYRQYGDQLSLFGVQAGDTITVKPAALQTAVDDAGPAIWNPLNLPVLVGFVHVGSMMAYDLSNPGAPQTPGQIGSWSEQFPTTTVDATGIMSVSGTSKTWLITPVTESLSTSPNYQPGPNYTTTFENAQQNVINAIQTITNSQSYVQAYQAIVQALQPLNVDPPPGYGYSLVEASGSPGILSIDLPIDINDIGWVLTYYTDSGTVVTTTIYTNFFDFPSAVYRVDFHPIDAMGDPIFFDNFENPELIFGLAFNGDGTFNGTVTTSLLPLTARSSVPEPSTWAMMLLGFAGLGYAGYRARRPAVAASL